MFPYKDVFDKTEQCLYRNWDKSKAEFKAWGDYWKQYEDRSLTDDEFYTTLVHIIFFAGFRSETVVDRLDVIDKYFDDFRKVAKYDENKIKKIMNDKKMIRHEGKIRACVSNARIFKDLIREYGTFSNYLNYFQPKDSFENTMKLYDDVRFRFDYIGNITAYHVLTDIGLDVIKPDRVITRIFTRLGLIENEKQIHEAVHQGRKFSEATGYPPRYIDIVFVAYGQVGDPGICFSSNPRCDVCDIKGYCNYSGD